MGTISPTLRHVTIFRADRDVKVGKKKRTWIEVVRHVPSFVNLSHVKILWSMEHPAWLILTGLTGTVAKYATSAVTSSWKRSSRTATNCLAARKCAGSKADFWNLERQNQMHFVWLLEDKKNGGDIENGKGWNHNKACAFSQCMQLHLGACQSQFHQKCASLYRRPDATDKPTILDCFGLKKI